MGGSLLQRNVSWTKMDRYLTIPIQRDSPSAGLRHRNAVPCRWKSRVRSKGPAPQLRQPFRIRVSEPIQGNVEPHSGRYGRVRGFLWRKRKLVIGWAALTVLWSGYWFAHSAYNQETVPISGRRRYAGPADFNVSLSQFRQEVRRRIREPDVDSEPFKQQMIPWLPVALPGAIMTGLGILTLEEMIVVPGLLMTILPTAPFVAYGLVKARSRELEADYIGLLLMTEAGYDPMAAISIHDTMAKWEEEYFEASKRQHGADKIKKPPHWLDTHPNVSASRTRPFI